MLPRDYVGFQPVDFSMPFSGRVGDSLGLHLTRRTGYGDGAAALPVIKGEVADNSIFLLTLCSESRAASAASFAEAARFSGCRHHTSQSAKDLYEPLTDGSAH